MPLSQPFARGSSSSLRWDMLADTPTELVAELAAARDALRHGRSAEADKYAARLLRHAKEHDPKARPRPVITQPLSELRACALVVRGLAADRERRREDSRRFFGQAVDAFDELAHAGRTFDPAALADYGTALLFTGRPEAASERVADALAADADIPADLVRRLGETLRRRGNHERACQVLRAAHKRYPRHAEIAADLARALERAGEPDSSVDVYMTAGMLLAGEGRLTASLNHFSRARLLGPNLPQPALAEAQVLLAQDQLPEAEGAIEELVKKYPDVAGGYALRAELLARQGRDDQALDMVKWALARFDADPWLLDTRIQLLLATGSLAEARHVLDQALAFDPDDADWLRLKAEVLLQSGGAGSEAEAAEVLDRLTAAAPKSVEHCLALVEVLASAGRHVDALDTLGSALQLYPHDPRLLGRQAELLAQEGQHLAAAAAAREALAQGGGTQAAALLAASLLAAGDADDAVKVATGVLRDAPDLAAMWKIRGLAHLMAGANDKAIKDLEKAHTTDPGDGEVTDRLAEALERLGRNLVKAGENEEARGNVGEARKRFEQARERLERAVKLDPGRHAAHASLGEVLRRLGSYGPALDHLNIAVAALPESAWLLGTRGRVRRELGQPEAIDDLRRAAELNDRLPWVHAELGDALRVDGRFPEAREALETAVRLDPNSAWAWAIKGAAELGDGSYEQARSSLDQAIKLQKDYAWAWAMKGSLLLRIDELASALATVNEALKLELCPSWAWTTKGWLLDYLDRDPRECEHAFRQAMAGDPDDIDALIGIGEVLMRQEGREDEAREHFRLGVTKTEGHADLDAETLHGRGWCLLRLHRYEEAIRAIGKAARSDETLLQADFDIGLALLCWGRDKVAVEEYRAAAARAQTLPHPGRRSNLQRMAERDLKALMRETAGSPMLTAIHHILASITTDADTSDEGE